MRLKSRMCEKQAIAAVWDVVRKGESGLDDYIKIF